MQDAGCKIQDAGYMMQKASGFWMPLLFFDEVLINSGGLTGCQMQDEGTSGVWDGSCIFPRTLHKPKRFLIAADQRRGSYQQLAISNILQASDF